MRSERPKFYFSFWSPYSWVATRLLEESWEAARLDIEYIPYWPPDEESLALLRALGGDFLYVRMSREKHLYILQDIKRITTGLGFRLGWPVDDRPWLDLPHLAYLAACRLGKGREFFWAVHRARWEEGRNVCSQETIRELAEGVGLPPEPVASAPGDASVRREGAEALLRAHRDQVFGVPFFVKGYERFWGVDRLGTFFAALEGRPYPYLAGASLTIPPQGDGLSRGLGATAGSAQGAATIPEDALRAVGGYDKDCAGGCG
ncbi:MAG TPA: DsbA family protein [Vicinamibacteria bacterium]